MTRKSLDSHLMESVSISAVSAPDSAPNSATKKKTKLDDSDSKNIGSEDAACSSTEHYHKELNELRELLPKSYRN